MGNRLIRSQLTALPILALLFITGAQAGDLAYGVRGGPGPAPSNNPDYLPWTNRQVYDECDQSCLIQKANENLSLQALYIVHRMDTLNGKLQNDPGGVVAELRNICPSESTSSDDAKKCFNRYVRLQVATLRQLKTQIAKNQNALVSLRSDVKGFAQDGEVLTASDGTILRRTVSPDTIAQTQSGKRTLPPSSYVTDLNQDSMKYSYMEESQKLGVLASEKYTKWASELPQKPNEEDYYIWKSVLLDPSDPGAGKVAVLSRGADGKPKVDQAAFNAATKEYKERLNDFQDQVKSAAVANAPAPTLPQKVVGQDALGDYKDARSEFLGSSQASAPKSTPGRTSAVGTLSFGGNDVTRSVASSQSGSGKQTQVPARESYTTWNPDSLEETIQSYESLLPECKQGSCYPSTPATH